MLTATRALGGACHVHPLTAPSGVDGAQRPSRALVRSNGGPTCGRAGLGPGRCPRRDLGSRQPHVRVERAVGGKRPTHGRLHHIERGEDAFLGPGAVPQPSDGVGVVGVETRQGRTTARRGRRRGRRATRRTTRSRRPSRLLPRPAIAAKRVPEGLSCGPQFVRPGGACTCPPGVSGCRRRSVHRCGPFRTSRATGQPLARARSAAWGRLDVALPLTLASTVTAPGPGPAPRRPHGRVPGGRRRRGLTSHRVV